MYRAAVRGCRSQRRIGDELAVEKRVRGLVLIIIDGTARRGGVVREPRIVYNVRAIPAEANRSSAGGSVRAARENAV